MGGVRIDTTCRSNLEGLFVAGEDSCGVHGANRLGGNGVACSTVFGGVAGDHMAPYIADCEAPTASMSQAQDVIARVTAPFGRSGGEDVYELRDALKALMWEQVGLVRHASGLEAAKKALEELQQRAQQAPVSGGMRLNAEWQEWLNVDSMCTVSQMIVASALAREESRGSHYRSDFPEPGDDTAVHNIYLQWDGERMRQWTEPVVFSRLKPPPLAAKAAEAAYLAQEGE